MSTPLDAKMTPFFVIARSEILRLRSEQAPQSVAIATHLLGARNDERRKLDESSNYKNVAIVRQKFCSCPIYFTPQNLRFGRVKEGGETCVATMAMSF